MRATPAATPLGSVALTITDPSALQASEYDLYEDPAQPGNWLLRGGSTATCVRSPAATSSTACASTSALPARSRATASCCSR